MALSLAQNAIALLIDLSERGDIDPWDVQVIDVIDRFLSQLQPFHIVDQGREAYEVNLSESGQAFLYASMLVLLKADSLARSETEQAAPEELVEEGFLDGEGHSPLPLHLERTIRRRATARPPANRRVTLQELIAQLEVMAAAVADPKPRVKTRRPRPQSQRQAVRAIAQLAHQENLSEVAKALEQYLAEHWDELSEGEEWMEFEQLLQRWVSSTEAAATREANAHHSDQSDRVGVFWALLFLSAQSKVELSQDEFYQDLKVRSLTTESEQNLTQFSRVVLGD